MKDWYKNAIIYKLDIETYHDSNGDGVGDFEGLIKKLPHLSGLGINCIWLLPFYPSPDRDNGYDVKDYYNVDPKYGTLGDFTDFINHANEYGIKIIIDLVVNHTSVEHPWFIDSKEHENSPYRDYYVWTKEKPQGHNKKVVFEGIEHSIWEYSEKTDAYYLHHFFKEQPDLNIANPKVQKEITKIMGFWLGLGISGFRIDAAHVLTGTLDQIHDEKEDLHRILNVIRNYQVNRKAEAILLGEANVEPEKLSEYFGNGDRLHLLFNFIVNKNIFLSLTRKNADPLYKAYDALKDIEGAYWVNFLRHHDELNLEFLSEEERQEVFKVFAPDENMRIFGHGIRRRFPPMVKGDRRLMELSYSLIFSLKGVPLLSYGEEIGMGEDLSLDGRASVRTLMQWDDTPNAGFSNAREDKLSKPVISEGEYGYKNINVLNQMNKHDSFLQWTTKLIKTRKTCPEIGNGKWSTIRTKIKEVFISKATIGDESILTIHNFSEKKHKIDIQENLNQFRTIDILGDDEYEIEQSSIFSINEYGYRWIRIIPTNNGVDK